MSENDTQGSIHITCNEMYGLYGEDVFKIGKAIDIQKRSSQYTTSCKSPVECVLCLLNVFIPRWLSHMFYKSCRRKSNRELFKADLLLIAEILEQTVDGINNGFITSVPSLPTLPNIKAIKILTETESIQLLDLAGQSDEVLEEFEDVLSSIESLDEHANIMLLLRHDEVANANHAQGTIAQPIEKVQFLRSFEKHLY